MKKIFILPVKLYQWILSPWLGTHCRHTPTCSQYMIESIEIHGPSKGMWLGFKRLCRCHPWGTQGYDPVPPAAKRTGEQNLNQTKRVEPYAETS
jgi:uncharacterized protein